MAALSVTQEFVRTVQSRIIDNPWTNVLQAFAMNIYESLLTCLWKSDRLDGYVLGWCSLIGFLPLMAVNPLPPITAINQYYRMYSFTIVNTSWFLNFILQSANVQLYRIQVF